MGGVSISIFLKTAWAFVCDRWAVLLLVTLLALAPRQAYKWLTHFGVFPDVLAGLQQSLLKRPDFVNDGWFSFFFYSFQRSTIAGFLNIFCFGLFNAIGLAALSAIAASWMSGQTLRAKTLIKRTLSGVLPVWAYLVVSFVILGIAFTLLIIPYVYLSVVWYVAHLAAADKRLWPIAAMQRSFELTRGARWILLAITLATFLISLLFNFAYGTAFRILLLSDFDKDSVLITLNLVRTVWAFVQYFISAVMIASVYVMLLRAYEGPAAAEIADTFD